MFSYKMLAGTFTFYVVLAGAQASAATISTVVAARGNSNLNSVDTLDGPTTDSAAINSFIGTTSQAAVSVDAVSGTFKARSDTRDIESLGIDENSIILRNLDYDASAFMLEEVTVTGNGSITFSMAYDGLWDLKGIGGLAPYFSATLDLHIIESTSPTPKGDPRRDGYALNNSGNRSAPLSGSVEGTLLATTVVDGSKSFFLRASLGTSIERGFGIVDFSNTAFLDYSTTGSVSVSFADPQFLSGVSPDPVPPSAVPLPAGGLLLLSGLIGVAGLKRRKK